MVFILINTLFSYNYQCIAISNMHIISQKRYKNRYASKKYAKPAVRYNFLQYVALYQFFVTILKTKNVGSYWKLSVLKTF